MNRIAVASWGANRLDLIVEDGHIRHKAWDGSQWKPSETGWDDLGAGFGYPAVVSWGPNRLDVFAVGYQDGQMYHKAWTGSQWYPSQTGWQALGGVFTPVAAPLRSPAVASWGPNRLDIFAVGAQDGQMYHKAWTGSQWYPSKTGWQPLGGNFKAPWSSDVVSWPAVASWGPNRLDIFVHSRADGQIYHKAWAGTHWHPTTGWQALGGAFGNGTVVPAVTSWAANRLDIFVVGQDYVMYQKTWDGSQWKPSTSGWQGLGGNLGWEPAVTSWAADRLDVFAMGGDRNVYHKAWNGSSWQPSQTGWQGLGGDGRIFTPPVAVSWGPNRLDIFAVSGTSDPMSYPLYHKAWSGSSWQPSQTGWEGLGGDFDGW
jgi:hypothetical protein